MMASFMRYCVQEQLTAEGWRAAMVSISVRSVRPLQGASGHFHGGEEVGGGHRPGDDARPAFWMAIH